MISHHHRCIFTHIPKTAGKSIRYLFGLPEFEWDYERGGRKIEDGFGHRLLRDLVDEKYFTDYFKFAFVRNPFDRLVSAYCYPDTGGCNEVDKRFREKYLAQYKGDFAAFTQDLSKLVAAPHLQPQVAWLCDNRGTPLADFIGRYESLERDAFVVGARPGLSFQKMPILNASKHDCYRSYYDAASRRRVAQVYGEDLELFSYRFECMAPV